MKKEFYARPSVEQIDAGCQAMVCTSPQPGENESVGFEKWTF